jgi:hypothetical protein
MCARSVPLVSHKGRLRWQLMAGKVSIADNGQVAF